jgi:chemotaxis protein MotB
MWKKCQTELKGQQEVDEGLRGRLARRDERIEKLEEKKNKLSQRVKLQKNTISVLREQARAQARKVAELTRQSETMRSRTEMLHRLAVKLQKEMPPNTVKVVVRTGRLMVVISDEVLFARDGSRLKDDGKSPLRKIAALLKQVPTRSFVMAGHADGKVPEPKQLRSSWALSVARAGRIVKFLRSEGVAPNSVSAAGYAELGSRSQQPGGRRIAIIVVPALVQVPQESAGDGQPKGGTEDEPESSAGSPAKQEVTKDEPKEPADNPKKPEKEPERSGEPSGR